MDTFEEIAAVIKQASYRLMEKYQSSPTEAVGLEILIRGAHVNAISRLTDAVIELEKMQYYQDELDGAKKNNKEV